MHTVSKVTDGDRSDGSLASRRTLNEIVGSVLSDHIRSGALPEGFVIREKAVSDIFGLGRMPVSIAISRLEAEGLVHRRPSMQGTVVGRRPTAALVIGGLEGRLKLPREIEAELKIRNWRALIYPQVERDVAACLLLGRFQIRSQVLAEHFGVSRTVAHELLLRLERVGLIQQEANARWYAGPLTAERIKELYQMRIMLEPEALRQAAPHVDGCAIGEKLAHVAQAEASQPNPQSTLLHLLEVDLHQDLVLRCTNAELRNTLYRCQLPLITVHLSFGGEEDGGVSLMVRRHKAVLTHLAAGRTEEAALALERHLTESHDGNPIRLANLSRVDRSHLSPYLDPA